MQIPAKLLSGNHHLYTHNFVTLLKKRKLPEVNLIHTFRLNFGMRFHLLRPEINVTWGADRHKKGLHDALTVA